MNTLLNFCRVCLKSDKNLIDLEHIENEPNETLMSKLLFCVAEVEWATYKPLLCHPCIKRLNTAYAFKKQCIHTSTVMKSYLELVQESKQTQNDTKCENVAQGGTIMLLPNQNFVKIVVGSNNQNPTNTFQNVFLNLIPASTISFNGMENTNKDTNENVFTTLNNAGNKFVPIAPAPDGIKCEPIEFNESKTEEVSVEIDPMCFSGTDLLEEADDEENSANNQDWDDIISSAKIESEKKSQNGDKITDEKTIYDSFVPILPKCEDFGTSGQHFLYSNTDNSGDLTCETCLRHFSSLKEFKQHIREFHMGNVLTLKDFKNEQTKNDELEGCLQSNGSYKCNMCKRLFTSATGLLRHKVRKHNQKNRKKYFIKGMKNARCDICNRAFSTNSYMQLHRKLHLRDEKQYKYKVLGVSHVLKNDFSGDSDSQMNSLHDELDLDDVKIEVNSEESDEH